MPNANKWYYNATRNPFLSLNLKELFYISRGFIYKTKSKEMCGSWHLNENDSVNKIQIEQWGNGRDIF